MDIVSHLKERTNFFRFFYENGTQPFRDIMRKIEDENFQFDPEHCDDGGEELSDHEYAQAWYGVEMIGVATLCMLSDSLKIFFSTLAKTLDIDRVKVDWSGGFVNGYRKIFGNLINEDWSSCPANIGVIEQIVMARNDAQHGRDLRDILPIHNSNTRIRYSNPFFINDVDSIIINTEFLEGLARMDLQISVTKERLFAAIDQVEILAEWMQFRLQNVSERNGDEA